MIFSEDQKEYKHALRKVKNKEKNIFDPDYVFEQQDSSVRNRSVKIGHGKKNIRTLIS